MEVMLIVVIGCVLAALLLFVRHAVGSASPAHRDDDLFTPVAPPPPAARPLDESPSDLFTPVDAGYHAGPRCFVTGLPVTTCTCPRHRQKGTRS